MTTLKRIAKLLSWTATLILAAIVTILLVRAFDARRLPDLEIWHEIHLAQEFRERDHPSSMTFAQYRELEDALTRELKATLLDRVSVSDEAPFNRFAPKSSLVPPDLAHDWNRSVELTHERPRGGALLIHGLTDSPYSLRSVAHILHRQGFYVLALRLPGHGTAPGELRHVRWQDWMAAVRMAARHVRQTVGENRPLYLVGYSAGGALAVRYALERAAGDRVERVDRLLLFSPAIGVSPFGRIGNWHKTLSFLPFFRKFEWLDISPEYDPFKYNSFPKNAGFQMFLLTKAIGDQIDSLKSAGGLRELPPMVAFQSAVDATVYPEAVVDRLFANLDGPDHEIVLFDVNRLNRVERFVRQGGARLSDRLLRSPDLHFALTVITNRAADSHEVVAITKRTGSPGATREPLGLSWPPGLYSLSHVAIPFPPEDRVYGNPPNAPTLGNMQPRGEKDILQVPLSQLMRLRFNPFFPYIEQRVVQFASNEPGP